MHAASPASVGDGAVGVVERAASVRQAVDDVALVAVAVGLALGALARALVHLPVAVVQVAVGFAQCAASVLAVGFEVASVRVAVLVGELAVAVHFAHKPLSVVLASVVGRERLGLLRRLQHLIQLVEH